ncbi:MAG: 16S rRNA (adenine(1518)-N(6)/adenine(1519)-N(6))-dimethyltransferase RsmA [Thermofilaceae archaeon]
MTKAASSSVASSWQLASRRYVREALNRFGIKPRKRLGQHFLVSRRALEAILEAVDPREGEVVYEIGAGLGALTAALAERGARVVAVEVDGRLVEALRERFRGCPLVDILHGDALRLPLPRSSKVVGNIPYSISSPLIVKLLREQSYELAVLTLQREFALRLAAKPGSRDYGRLSVLAQLYASVEIVGSVSRKAFYPEPEVDSLIVKLKPRREHLHLFPCVEELTAPLFSQRRKKLSKVLKRLGLDPEAFASFVDLEKRVYELTPTEILRLAEARHTSVLPAR